MSPDLTLPGLRPPHPPPGAQPPTPTPSPFHRGEQAMQARLGIRDRMEEIGRRVIRDHMPDQHRELFEKLPFLVVGGIDDEGRPWAGLVSGEPGFVATAPRDMEIAALPDPTDPLDGLIRPGRPVGVLGIEFETRRRNRMNGVVRRRTEFGFAIAVEQSFGNCPKYIRARTPRRVRRAAEPAVRQEGPRLSATALSLLETADTFFIASANPAHDGRAAGVDVSHRGGRPGFVHVARDGERTVLTVPDFSGNGFFNTFGNLTLDPRCGLLVPDFARGHLLHLSARADVVWEGPDLDAFAGAQRLLRLSVEGGVHRGRALDFAWTPGEASPHLDATGRWPSVTGPLVDRPTA